MDRRQQFLGGSVLEEVTGGTRLDRCQDVGVGVIVGEDEDFRGIRL